MKTTIDSLIASCSARYNTIEMRKFYAARLAEYVAANPNTDLATLEAGVCQEVSSYLNSFVIGSVTLLFPNGCPDMVSTTYEDLRARNLAAFKAAAEVAELQPIGAMAKAESTDGISPFWGYKDGSGNTWVLLDRLSNKDHANNTIGLVCAYTCVSSLLAWPANCNPDGRA